MNMNIEQMLVCSGLVVLCYLVALLPGDGSVMLPDGTKID